MPAPQVSPRLSFRNVLFPTDFSSASEATLPYVKALSPMEPVPLDLDGEWRNPQKLLTRFLNRDPLRRPPAAECFKGVIFGM